MDAHIFKKCVGLSTCGMRSEQIYKISCFKCRYQYNKLQKWVGHPFISKFNLDNSF